MFTSSVSLNIETRGSQLHRSEERWVGGTFTHYELALLDRLRADLVTRSDTCGSNAPF
jgi:hypothetical protein